MRRSLSTAVVCALLAGASAACAGAEGRGNGQAAVTATDEERAARDLVARYVDARERRDSDAIRALFTSDADQLTTSGEWRRGREQIVSGTAASSERNPGTRTIDIVSVRFPSPDVALADGRYEIRGTTGTPRAMWTTFVLARRPEGWRIAAIRNMRPTTPMAP